MEREHLAERLGVKEHSSCPVSLVLLCSNQRSELVVWRTDPSISAEMDGLGLFTLLKWKAFPQSHKTKFSKIFVMVLKMPVMQILLLAGEIPVH